MRGVTAQPVPRFDEPSPPPARPTSKMSERVRRFRERLRPDPRQPPRIWLRQQWPGLLALALVLGVVYFLDAWVLTCGFDGCPTGAEIRAFHPTEGGHILDRYRTPMGRLRLVRRVNAALAALPTAPSAYAPRKAPHRAVRRRNLVLGLMTREGYITADQARAAATERLAINREGWRPDSRTDSYALDVVREIVDSVREAQHIESFDLTVMTTLDLKAQQAAEGAVYRRANAIASVTGRAGAQGAMVALDPRTGDVRALVGGRVYERGNFNRAIDARRQPGSAFKPFVYAAALQSGMTPATQIDDDPVEVQIDRNKVWRPQNYEGSYLGEPTLP